MEMDYIDKSMENIHIKGFEIKYNDTQLKIKEELINLFSVQRFMPPKKEEIYEKLDYEKKGNRSGLKFSNCQWRNNKAK